MHAVLIGYDVIATARLVTCSGILNSMESSQYMSPIMQQIISYCTLSALGNEFILHSCMFHKSQGM
jgi:hypothetical protein